MGKDRCQDQQDRRWFHEVAGNQQHDIDHDQELPARQSPTNDGFRHDLRNALGGQYMGEQHGVGNDEQQHHRDLTGIREYSGYVAKTHVTMDEQGDHEGVDRSDRRRFGGGEETAVDTAHHHDNQTSPQIASRAATSSSRNEARGCSGIFIFRALTKMAIASIRPSTTPGTTPP